MKFNTYLTSAAANFLVSEKGKDSTKPTYLFWKVTVCVSAAGAGVAAALTQIVNVVASKVAEKDLRRNILRKSRFW